MMLPDPTLSRSRGMHRGTEEQSGPERRKAPHQKVRGFFARTVQEDRKQFAAVPLQGLLDLPEWLPVVRLGIAEGR